MKQNTQKQAPGLAEIGLGLDDIIRRGARQVIQQAIEAELAQLLEQYDNAKTLHGKPVIVRNGYLPERDILTAVGPVTVKVPKVRDRSGSGVKFNSNLVPPYVRRSARVSAALPWLYLKGISTGDMSEALAVLVGDEAKGLSPNVVSRLNLETAIGTVARRTRALKMRDKIAKYSAAVAHRYGEDRFCDFVAQIRRLSHSQ